MAERVRVIGRYDVPGTEIKNYHGDKKFNLVPNRHSRRSADMFQY